MEVKSNLVKKKGNLNGHLMEIVDEWVYLGGDKYYCAQKQLACQARKPC